MMPHFTRYFNIQNILTIQVFATIYANGNPTSCEVFYEKNHYYGSDVICLKTKESLSDLRGKYAVVKYDCGDKERNYQNCEGKHNFETLQSMDCALRPEIFNICSNMSVNFFNSSEKNQNPVLRNNTFNSELNLRRILLSRNGIESIESGAFGCQKRLARLELSENNITLLPVDVFKCIRNLLTLRLDFNRIHMLLQGTFDGLPRLQVLNLTSNLIVHLPNQIFHKLTILRFLYLNSNKLKSLNPSTFSKVTNLRYLELRENNIKNLTESLFSQQRQLMVLDIGMNPGLVLSNVSFAGLNLIVKLRIDGCESNLISEASGMFFHIPSLAELSMQNNHLQEITSELFSPLDQLNHLNLSFNDIKILSGKPFENNSKLESFDISRNNLKEIKRDDFRGLSSVKYLNISHNSIVQVAPESFDDLRKLEHLNISNNAMSALNGSHVFQTIFPKLVNLTKLDMHNSSSEKFKIRFSEMNPNLKRLDISCNVGHLLQSNTFNGLSKLRYLYMRDSNITFSDFSVLDELAYNEMIEEIDVSGNKMTEFKCDSQFPRLIRLDFSSNIIETIDIHYYRCDIGRLEFLNLSHNRLSQLPEPLFKEMDMRYLKTFDVSYNNLTAIQWNDVKNVDTVWAAHNNITLLCIPHIAATGIRTIHLEANRIQRVPADFDFTQVSWRSVMKTIHMSENPLTCDCNDYKLFGNLKSALYPIHFAGLTCQYPPELEKKEFMALFPDDFTCNVLKSCPEACRCMHRAHDSATIANCSQRGLVNLPPYVPRNTTILLVGHNNLTSLGRLNESQWENLTEIYAERNEISTEEFYVPEKLKVFVLDENRLTALPETVRKHAEAIKDFQISLSSNPWPCECSSLPLKTFLSAYSDQVRNVSEIRCTLPNGSINSQSLNRMQDFDLCPSNSVLPSQFTTNVVIIITLALAAICLVKIYDTNKKFIQILIYTHCNLVYRLLCCYRQMKEEKTYDCFISYCTEDRDVMIAIIEELGREPTPEFTFCVHERHWKGGSLITENIFNSVEQSRKTLFILTETFVRNKWFHLEFQAALMKTLEDRRNRIILVLKGKLPERNQLSKELQHVLTTRTYLEWGERWFFQKLRYSLEEDVIPLRDIIQGFILKLRSFRGKRRNYSQGVKLDDTYHPRSPPMI